MREDIKMKKLMKYTDKTGMHRDIEHITSSELFYENKSLLNFLDDEAENDLMTEVRFSLESGKTPLFFCNEMGCNSRDAS